MVENLKELLMFGSFEPVVSVERETTAISVPDKVFSDMRKCCAGIIHIEEEQTLLDAAGKSTTLKMLVGLLKPTTATYLRESIRKRKS